MSRSAFLFCLASSVVLLANPPARADDDVVVVKVKGEGIDEDAAKKDALRKAVETGGKNEIASKSQTKDFALEYDVVLARATGLVKDYKVLSTRSSDGVVIIEIEAKVSKKLIDATWAEVAILLKQLGRPKIMVIFTEVIHDLDRPEHNREIVQRDSKLGAEIERKLLKLGFKLVNPGQIKEIERKKLDAATLEDNTDAIKAIASQYGAQVFIKGVARANGPQRTTAAGIQLHMWESDMSIQGFWTETGDAIFSNTSVGTRGGSRVAGPAGATQVLQKTGMKMAEASVYDLLEAWSRGAAGGQVGDIIIEVANVADARQAMAIKKALAGVKGIEEVTNEGVKGLVRYTLQTNMTADSVLEHLVELKFDGFTIDVEDQKSKTISCKVK